MRNLPCYPRPWVDVRGRFSYLVHIFRNSEVDPIIAHGGREEINLAYKDQ